MTTETTKKRSSLTRRQALAATGAAAGALFLGGKAPAYAAAKHKLRYIAFINRNTVWGKPYDFLAAEVDKLSGGELEIEYAGGSDVIGGFDAPEAIANGVFDISHSANSYFAGAVPSSPGYPGISPIPAIINAIANATGARVRDIPATPDRVKAALEEVAAG